MQRSHLAVIATMLGAVLLCTSPARVIATNLDIFMTAEGEQQGQIAGDATYPGEEGSIALIGYSHMLSIPIDPVTGQQTGQLQHGPVTITKYHDASTLAFLNALIDSEHMGLVNIRFYDGNAAPGVLLYEVELSNALISARSESETTADYFTEEIQMAYQMITWTWAGQSPLTAGEPEPIVLRHALMPPTPNPMHADATFRFGLPEDTYATLEVFDVSGRLVRDVFDGSADMNEVVHWDGRDRSGNAVASGVYLVRLEWKGGSATRRVTVLE